LQKLAPRQFLRLQISIEVVQLCTTRVRSLRLPLCAADLLSGKTASADASTERV